ncbi:MAG TPA: hypothetical protein VGM44_17715 [Polyangiaceae bacterium]
MRSGSLNLPKIMLEHRRFAASVRRLVNPTHLRRTIIGCSLLLPAVAHAGAKDQIATKLANQAMQTDYVGTQFKKAEQKLKKAIQQCGSSACSYDVVGRLHRDLATVYIGGTNQVAKGKAELKLALQANPDLQLDNDLATPELKKDFKALGGHEPKHEDEDKDDSDEKPEKPAAKDQDSEAGENEEKPAPPPSEESSSGARKNWVSIGFEQDFLVYSSTNDVCATNGIPDSNPPSNQIFPEAPGYACFQGGSQYGYSAGQTIYPNAGNHVGAGVGVSTSSVLLGFDRVIGSNFSVGARVGFAFGGGPQTLDGSKFLPLRLEIRGNYWFGNDPFASSSVRPYVGLSAGVAELDGHVPVEYYQDAAGYSANNKGTLDAWRRAGKTFAGLGFGLMVPIAGSSGIVPELRVKEMFGSSSLAFDASLGYAYGF